MQLDRGTRYMKLDLNCIRRDYGKPGDLYLLYDISSNKSWYEKFEKLLKEIDVERSNAKICVYRDGLDVCFTKVYADALGAEHKEEQVKEHATDPSECDSCDDDNVAEPNDNPLPEPEVEHGNISDTNSDSEASNEDHKQFNNYTFRQESPGNHTHFHFHIAGDFTIANNCFYSRNGQECDNKPGSSTSDKKELRRVSRTVQHH